MNEDINCYKFYFEKEVNDLKHMLGQKAENIVFVNVDPFSSTTVVRIIPPKSLKNGLTHKIIQAQIAWLVQDYKADPDYGSLCVPILDFDSHPTNPPTLGNIVCMAVNDTWNFEDNNSVLKLFNLYHETGHALLHYHPKTDDTHPLGECAADAYAAICCIQKFGHDAACQVLSRISWNRALLGVVGDTEHLTTTVLDKIIADSARRDFSKLSATETIELADKYAKNWTPDPFLMYTAKNLFSSFSDNDFIDLELLFNTCLAAPVNRFTFYIGAKVFQPFLHPDGVLYSGKQYNRYTPPEQHHRSTTIAKTCQGMTLSDIFYTSVATSENDPPLTETLTVCRPTRKSHLLLNDFIIVTFVIKNTFAARTKSPENTT